MNPFFLFLNQVFILHAVFTTYLLTSQCTDLPSVFITRPAFLNLSLYLIRKFLEIEISFLRDAWPRKHTINCRLLWQNLR